MNKYDDYCVLRTTCLPSTIAMTSNKKFIAPMSKVYYDKYTQAWTYPSETKYSVKREYPNSLKAWSTSNAKEQNNKRSKYYNNRHHFNKKDRSCKNCHKSNHWGY